MTIDTQRLATDPDYWRECGAPEDAEAAIDNGWIKKTKRAHKTWSWMPFTSSGAFPAGEWYPTGSDFDKSPWCKVIPRPQAPEAEWVDGLPPVGCECEMQPAAGEPWYVVHVIAHFEGSAVFAAGDDYPNGCYDGCSHPENFRPIRTKQERQREELVSVISSALDECYVNGGMEPSDVISDSDTRVYSEAVADAIIADGWTKP